MANDQVSPRSEGVWVIIYAPGEHDLEVFMGAGAEEAARKRYAIAKLNWTCHLFREAACSQTVAPGEPPESNVAHIAGVIADALHKTDPLYRKAAPPAVSTPRCPVTSSTFDLWWPEQEFQPPNDYRELAAIAVAFAKHCAQPNSQPSPALLPDEQMPCAECRHFSATHSNHGSRSCLACTCPAFKPPQPSPEGESK